MRPSIIFLSSLLPLSLADSKTIDTLATRNAEYGFHLKRESEAKVEPTIRDGKPPVWRFNGLDAQEAIPWQKEQSLANFVGTNPAAQARLSRRSQTPPNPNERGPIPVAKFPGTPQGRGPKENQRTPSGARGGHNAQSDTGADRGNPRGARYTRGRGRRGDMYRGRGSGDGFTGRFAGGRGNARGGSGNRGQHVWYGPPNARGGPVSTGGFGGGVGNRGQHGSYGQPNASGSAGPTGEFRGGRGNGRDNVTGRGRGNERGYRPPSKTTNPLDVTRSPLPTWPYGGGQGDGTED